MLRLSTYLAFGKTKKLTKSIASFFSKTGSFEDAVAKASKLFAFLYYHVFLANAVT